MSDGETRTPRSREEIMKELGDCFPHNRLMLEVLLDIRDQRDQRDQRLEELLTKLEKPQPPQTTQTKPQAAVKPQPQQPSSPSALTNDDVEKMPWVASSWVRKDDQNREAMADEHAWINVKDSDSRLVRMMNDAGCRTSGSLDRPEFKYMFEYKVFTDSSTELIIRKPRKAAK